MYWKKLLTALTNVMRVGFFLFFDVLSQWCHSGTCKNKRRPTSECINAPNASTQRLLQWKENCSENKSWWFDEKGSQQGTLRHRHKKKSRLRKSVGTQQWFIIPLPSISTEPIPRWSAAGRAFFISSCRLENLSRNTNRGSLVLLLQAKMFFFVCFF